MQPTGTSAVERTERPDTHRGLPFADHEKVVRSGGVQTVRKLQEMAETGKNPGAPRRRADVRGEALQETPHCGVDGRAVELKILRRDDHAVPRPPADAAGISRHGLWGAWKPLAGIPRRFATPGVDMDAGRPRPGPLAGDPREPAHDVGPARQRARGPAAKHAGRQVPMRLDEARPPMLD